MGRISQANGEVLPCSICRLKLQSLMVVRTFTGDHVIANMEVDQMSVFVGPVVCYLYLVVCKQW
jgi:hypothetical protein